MFKKYLFMYLFINNYRVPFKVTPVKYNTLMPAFFPIVETLLKRYRQQHLFRFFFYLFNRSKTLSSHRCFQFWEEEKVSGGQVRWIRLLRHDYGIVLGKTSRTSIDVCAGTLSWCKIHNCFNQNSVCFLGIASSNRYITSR